MLGVGVGDGPAVLDHIAALGDTHDQGGVVEVEWPPALPARLDGLPEAPVQLDEPATRPEREPVQLDAGLGGLGREPGLRGTGRLRLLRHNGHDRLRGASLAFLPDPSTTKVAPFVTPAGSFAASAGHAFWAHRPSPAEPSGPASINSTATAWVGGHTPRAVANGTSLPCEG